MEKSKTYTKVEKNSIISFHLLIPQLQQYQLMVNPLPAPTFALPFYYEANLRHTVISSQIFQYVSLQKSYIRPNCYSLKGCLQALPLAGI